MTLTSVTPEQAATLDRIARKIAKRSSYGTDAARSAVWQVALSYGGLWDERLGTWRDWANRWIYRRAWRLLCDDAAIVHVPNGRHYAGERSCRLDLAAAYPLAEPQSTDGPASASSDHDALLRCMWRLSPMQRALIVALYGLDGAEPKTIAQIAEARGVAKSGVRRLASIALRRIRSGAMIIGVTREDFVA
jgi:DNA-directed RNA polymerase specialized sigma24 family protein